MIKQSLNELRGKLDTMRKDKDAVESGMVEFESKYEWLIIINLAMKAITSQHLKQGQ